MPPRAPTSSAYRSQVSLAREDGVRAGNPVEEHEAVEVVELVLQGAGLERVGLDARTSSPVPGSRPRTTRREARFTSPVKSGTDMQPSRDFSLRDGRLDAGVDQHVLAVASCAPWGAPTRRGENTRQPTPTWLAASPTQPGETRCVASRSAASCTTAGSVGSTSTHGVESTSAGAVTTGSTRPSGSGGMTIRPSTMLTRGLQDVGVGGVRSVARTPSSAAAASMRAPSAARRRRRPAAPPRRRARRARRRGAS